MSAEESIEAAADHHNPKTLIRSQYKDVMVKVDEDIYYLDRLQLALKSAYFEKLFTEDYSDKNSDLIELPLMDTDTFSAVVGVIYGEELKSVLNSDNFVSLLMAMDYLQMHIDPKTYKSFAAKELDFSDLNKDIFQLYYFIADDAKYEYLLPIVFYHLAEHLEELKDRDEILSIKFDHIIKIISNGDASIYNTPFRTVSKLCARWICHDVENRLHHAVYLVNAAKFRFNISNEISRQDFNLELFSNKEHLNQNSISTYIHKLMMYCGEIRCPDADTVETIKTLCPCAECNNFIVEVDPPTISKKTTASYPVVNRSWNCS
ncbi:kelch-like protein 23 isoform X2 [Planococcus citri]|uniref:kelch-like protein 23 isoform X2 n=1 Tax=Planococcus citri TaxID=170843 RepID=UPI0031F90E03